MSVPFRRPTPAYRFDLEPERRALDEHFERREVPTSKRGALLLATWNIANLGRQARSASDLALIAHILARFDLVAVQEVSGDAAHFVRIAALLGPDFGYVMTDASGNFERLAFIYRHARVRRGVLAGELALDPDHYPHRTVRVPYVADGVDRVAKHQFQFQPFARTPFLHAFVADELALTLANAHLYRGKWTHGATTRERLGYCRRVLEAYALARWAARANRAEAHRGHHVLVLGDLNIPSMSAADPIRRSLHRFGLRMEPYPSRTGGSNLANDRDYDQIAFHPRGMARRIATSGVFDFDNAIFRPLWTRLEERLGHDRAAARFNAHVRAHVSDHRPVWLRLKTR